jgi:hypothetical protein
VHPTPWEDLEQPVKTIKPPLHSDIQKAWASHQRYMTPDPPPSSRTTFYPLFLSLVIRQVLSLPGNGLHSFILYTTLLLSQLFIALAPATGRTFDCTLDALGIKTKGVIRGYSVIGKRVVYQHLRQIELTAVRFLSCLSGRLVMEDSRSLSRQSETKPQYSAPQRPKMSMIATASPSPHPSSFGMPRPWETNRCPDYSLRPRVENDKVALPSIRQVVLTILLGTPASVLPLTRSRLSLNCNSRANHHMTSTQSRQ